jgi:hypothetical protein
VKRFVLVGILGWTLGAAPATPAAGSKSTIEFGGLKWHQVNTDRFSVKDGWLILDKGRGWLRSDREYADFVLTIEWKFVDKGADSGIFVRTGAESGGGNGWPLKAIQIQCMDNDSLAGVFAAKEVTQATTRRTDLVKQLRKPTGELNVMEIRCEGKKMAVKLNGAVVTTCENLVPAKGYIGIQGEGGTLHFKRIEIKELKSGGSNNG